MMGTSLTASLHAGVNEGGVGKDLQHAELLLLDVAATLLELVLGFGSWSEWDGHRSRDGDEDDGEGEELHDGVEWKIR